MAVSGILISTLIFENRVKQSWTVEIMMAYRSKLWVEKNNLILLSTCGIRNIPIQLFYNHKFPFFATLSPFQHWHIINNDVLWTRKYTPNGVCFSSLTVGGIHWLKVRLICEKEKVYTRNKVYFFAVNSCILLSHFIIITFYLLTVFCIKIVA